MKRNLIYSFVIVIVGIVLFSSCSPMPKHAQYIPSDAAFVSVIDIVSIAQKGKLQDAKSLKMYSQAIEFFNSTNQNTGILLESLVTEPKKTGIDIFSDLFVYSVIQNEKVYMCVSVKLDNKENFQNLMEGILGDEFDLQEQDAFTYYTNESNTWIAFNDKNAVFISSGQAKSDEALELIQRIFTQSKDESIAESKEFIEFYKQKKDVSIWISSTHIIEGMSNETKKAIEKNLESFQGLSINDILNNYIHLFLNFEEDDITLDFNLQANDAFKTFLDKTDFTKDKLSEEVLSFLPQTSYFLMSYAFESDKLVQYLQSLPDFKQLDDEIQNQGVSLKEFISALNGDIVLSVFNASLDVVQKNKTLLRQDSKGRYQYVDTVIYDEQIIPKAAMVLSLKDEEYMKKFIAEKIPAELYTEQDSYLDFTKTLNFPLYLGIHNNMLMLSTDIGAMSQLYDGGYPESLSTSDLVQEIDAAAFYYVNLDFETYPIQVKEFVNKSFLQHILKPYLNTFESLTISSNGLYSGRLQIKLKNSKENSLYQVLEMLDGNFKQQ